MAVDNSFIMRKIRERDSVIVAFSAATNMPFVTCDEETFNDQIWVFEDDAQFKNFADAQLQKKIRVVGAKIEQKAFLPFYSSLFLLGINEIVFVLGGTTMHVDLEKIVQKPDYSKMKPVPVVNPSLQLTGMYFGQEAGRAVPNDQKDLKDLQEELAADMARATFIMPVQPGPGNEPLQEKIKNNNFRMIMVKNSEGDMYQTIFTDLNECRKFARNKQLATVVVPFLGLEKFLDKNAKGYMLNPAGFHLVMNRELLKGLAPAAADMLRQMQENKKQQV